MKVLNRCIAPKPVDENGISMPADTFSHELQSNIEKYHTAKKYFKKESDGGSEQQARIFLGQLSDANDAVVDFQPKNIEEFKMKLDFLISMEDGYYDDYDGVFQRLVTSLVPYTFGSIAA